MNLNVPIYRTPEGINFVAIAPFAYNNTKYYAVLNLLDEELADNDLIRFPIVEAWDMPRFANAKIRGHMEFDKCTHLFWRSYHRTLETFFDSPIVPQNNCSLMYLLMKVSFVTVERLENIRMLQA